MLLEVASGGTDSPHNVHKLRLRWLWEEALSRKSKSIESLEVVPCQLTRDCPTSAEAAIRGEPRACGVGAALVTGSPDYSFAHGRWRTSG